MLSRGVPPFSTVDASAREGCALQLCDIKETVGAKVPQELAEH